MSSNLSKSVVWYGVTQNDHEQIENIDQILIQNFNIPKPPTLGQ